MEEYRTKRGSCTFGSEKLMMEESITGYFRNTAQGFWHEGGLNEKIFFLIGVSAVSYSFTFLIGVLYHSTAFQKTVTGFMTVGIILILWLIQKHRGFVKEKFVKYENIDKVDLIEGKKWFTCPRFIISFKDGDEIKKRYLTMPTHFMPGTEESMKGIKEEFESRDIEVNVS